MGDESKHKPSIKQKNFPHFRGASTSHWPEISPPDMFEKLRRLNSYELKAPEYQIKPQYLIEDCVERLVQYVGEIDGVSPHLDITNRTDVLRIIDKGKKLGVIPVQLSNSHLAILSLSVFNIKISRYNSTEDLLLRIPMHEIAAICYIKDDQQHILAIKFGTPEACKLALMYCDNKPSADAICALVGQCFTLVYTEALADMIESQLEPPPSTSSGTVSTIVHKKEPAFYASSVLNYQAQSDCESGRTSNSDFGTGKELLEDYMTKLTSRLNPEELRKFLQHLNDWKKDNHFHEFCEEVLALLGTDRKQLLSELLPFIPLDNYQYFEEFLRRNEIQILESSSTYSSSRTNLQNYPTRRSLSEVSTTSSVSNNAASGDAIDRLMDLTDAQFQSVDVDMERKIFPTIDYP